MEIQNQIKSTLSEKGSILYLKTLLTNTTFTNRSQVTEVVCNKFKSHNPNGQLQLSSCAKALRNLDAAGHIKLPLSTDKKKVKRSPQRLNTPVPIPVDVPTIANEVQGLKLILVQSTEERKLWSELMITAEVQ